MIRECNGCRACCTVFQIAELDKPARTPCPHECAAGCAIYGDHPESCQHFMCVWVRGFGEEHERPDRFGIYVEERGGPDLPHERQMIVKEVERGATKRAEVQDYLLRLKRASGLHVYIMNWEMDMIVGEIVDRSIRERRKAREKLRQRKSKKKGS